MISRTTRNFWRQYRKLPESVKRQAKVAYRKFMHNRNHPSLQFKRLRTSAPYYSVRINRQYRAIGLLNGNVIEWDFIGSHADYEEYIKSL